MPIRAISLPLLASFALYDSVNNSVYVTSYAYNLMET